MTKGEKTSICPQNITQKATDWGTVTLLTIGDEPMYSECVNSSCLNSSAHCATMVIWIINDENQETW